MESRSVLCFSEVKLAILQRKDWNDTDLNDSLGTTLGTCVHHICARATGEVRRLSCDTQTELRFSVQVFSFRVWFPGGWSSYVLKSHSIGIKKVCFSEVDFLSFSNFNWCHVCCREVVWLWGVSYGFGQGSQNIALQKKCEIKKSSFKIALYNSKPERFSIETKSRNYCNDIKPNKQTKEG